MDVMQVILLNLSNMLEMMDWYSKDPTHIGHNRDIPINATKRS